MNPRKILWPILIITAFAVFCSRAPGPFPALSNRGVLGEFFTETS